jgi:hypothetical protein
MVAAYVLLPSPQGDAPAVELITAAVIGTFIYLAAGAWAILLIHRSRTPVLTGVLLIIVMITAMVLIFAITYLTISADDPANFTEPLDKVDALYFTMTILSTVGFGDITARSSGARITVMVQMVVALTLLTALGNVLREVAKREKRRRLGE